MVSGHLTISGFMNLAADYSVTTTKHDLRPRVTNIAAVLAFPHTDVVWAWATRDPMDNGFKKSLEVVRHVRLQVSCRPRTSGVFWPEVANPVTFGKK